MMSFIISQMFWCFWTRLLHVPAMARSFDSSWLERTAGVGYLEYQNDFSMLSSMRRDMVFSAAQSSLTVNQPVTVGIYTKRYICICGSAHRILYRHLSNSDCDKNKHAFSCSHNLYLLSLCFPSRWGCSAALPDLEEFCFLAGMKS